MGPGPIRGLARVVELLSRVTDRDAYLERVRGLLILVVDRLTLLSTARVDHLIEHGDPAETVATLRELTAGMIDEEHSHPASTSASRTAWHSGPTHTSRLPNPMGPGPVRGLAPVVRRAQPGSASPSLTAYIAA
jgi:hypothetical protein